MAPFSLARAALLALVASSLSASAMPTITKDLPQPEDLPQSDPPANVSAAAAPANANAGSGAPPVMNKISMGFPYGQQKVRGVNLGGWLVLEPWITPYLFEKTGNNAIVDEWTFGQYQNRNTALNALKNHWNTWITENDFAQIAAAGLNHVRLPVGYWAYDVGAGEPYIQGQGPYVDKAIGWARNHGLKVLLELHGAPGSQNGYDNSGHRGDANFANSPNNAQRAKNVLNQLAQKYANSDVVTALGLLNEPATYISNQLLDYTTQFWRDAYGATRWPWAQNGNGAQSNLLLVISDGFQPLSHWNGFMSEPGYTSVAIDTHYYQVFSNEEVAWDWNTHLQQVCTKQSAYRNAPNWLFVGEWSLASTDCAKYLNGRGRGARYDGTMSGSPRVASCSDKTGNGNNFSPEYKDFMRHFYDTQTQVFENNGQGWFYWCWKNENAADWSYQKGLQLGYIPKNPTDHKYPLSNTCR